MTSRYLSSTAFKQSLEHRLRKVATAALPVVRRRQLLVFDRLLARLVAVFGNAAIVKGGIALALRREDARNTKDLDLRLTGSPHHLLIRLQEASQLDLGDFMTFEISADDAHPELRGDGMRYDGFRFRAECRLDGALYGQRFGLDVAFGDPILGEPDALTARDVLGFADVPPPRLRLYPVETHIAEKLHAYTLPRLRPNSRVKDLPDLALLATIQPLTGTRLTAALALTFQFRNTHKVPACLPDPPAVWQAPYAAIARESQLAWATLDKVFAAARQFLDPVLGGEQAATWQPADWQWQP